MATTVNLPVAAAKPPTVSTDSQGYLNSPARCAPNQTAVVVGRPALSDAVNYTVSERELLLTAGLRVLRDETMVEFRDYRIPTEAPITQQAANQQFR